MNNACLRSSLIFFIALSSCNEESKSYTILGDQASTEALHPISDSEVKITIQDYLEEAVSIRSEAEEIIIRAEEINCNEAKKIAESVLQISEKAEESTNLLRVEHYIEKASQTLSNAEDAIIYCEEKNEQSYSSSL